jgi:hypothetical protein
MPTLDAADNEQRARISSMKEAGRAALSGQTVAQRNRTRNARASEWSRWLRKEMEGHGCEDPAEVLPAALAHLQQIVDDTVIAAVRQLRSDLRKALTK